ncbi:M48 family metalloprotease [Nitrincola tapanii]|uniref:Peptidase M48 n=1 Tax=Nitrincola tapanii TaxID=1708751 RepID=A0A5A9W757_9GAMM|nr:M48 family metalloprotease [Nitrincola tapanii]KAA0876284.1 peptidase M48 [Nitrincola tapanii]
MDRRNFLKSGAYLALAGTATQLLSGCQTLGELASIADPYLTDDGRTILNILVSAGDAFTTLDPEQEYYLGRSVAANLFSQYKPWNNAAANEYINLVGKCVASASIRPETFGGYHFQILDSNELNAFSAPGGLILITRGMLRCCKNEDEVAAVLAHEVGHTSHQHGVRSIQNSRITSLATLIGTEALKREGNENILKLVNVFEDSLQDVTNTLVSNGYSRSNEKEADLAASEILVKVGYDPHALISLLETMDTRLRPGASDFAKTHPSPSSRIEDLASVITTKSTHISAARQRRFSQAMRSV